jgi:hypothetical protein
MLTALRFVAMATVAAADLVLVVSEYKERPHLADSIPCLSSACSIGAGLSLEFAHILAGVHIRAG